MDFFDADKLKDFLHFNCKEGVLSFGSERMLLFNQNALALLKRQLNHQLGEDMMRSILMKFGFECAKNDFLVISKKFRFKNDDDLLRAGPHMHAWSGVASVVPEFLNIDYGKGHFYFKGRWENSYEADNYIKEFGISNHPVCFTLAGYGSGWCSSFFGKDLLEVERKCIACGDPYCEWEIRPKEEWNEEAKIWRQALYEDHKSISKELELRTIELECLNRDLEERIHDRVKANQNLVRVLCHDLANPVSAIKNKLKYSDISDKDRKHLLEMTSFIEDILGRVREEQASSWGKSPFKKTNISLSKIIQESMLIFFDKIRQKDIKIIEDYKSSLPLNVWGEPVSLSHNVINNLISNAIKFSPRGGTITIGAQHVGKSIHFTISDEGIGMSRDLIAKLFDDHSPTSRLGTEGEQGTGFGMPIVREYLYLNGGQIEVESRPISQFPETCGTTITLKLVGCE